MGIPHQLFQKLSPILDSRYRLAIALILIEEEEISFSQLRDTLAISDGNLASHLKMLEKHDLISIKKTFVNRKPKTTYFLTLKGRHHCIEHFKLLEKLTKGFVD